MRVHYAIFGEVKKGHDLRAASGEAEFAARLIQYTDRPGDPPHGIDWGPVTSGFFVEDRYVFLRTEPDPEAGRAGMVRSYAAFVPAADLWRLNNIETVYASLPPAMQKHGATLEPLDIPDEDLAEFPAIDSRPGLVTLAVHLCAAGAKFPLVWATPEPYLPAVAALWSRLPATLRPAFAFAFQFAPELRLPVAPTLVATLPELANRWPIAQALPPRTLGVVTFDAAQSWLAGRPEGRVFADVLEGFDIEVTQFSKLGLLASLTDLISRLACLSFSEAKRAVNIVAKHGRATPAAAAARGRLFKRMCALVRGATAEDLVGLRNLDVDALSDLVPLLRNAMGAWLSALPPEVACSSAQLALLEFALPEPANWWSTPFCKWLEVQAKGAGNQGAQRIVGLFVSTPLSAFLIRLLPATDAVEAQLVLALPEKVAVSHADNLLRLAVERRWMRLHARALLHSQSDRQAVFLHAQVAGEGGDAGLEELRTTLGAPALVQVAAETGERNLMRFAARLLATEDMEVETAGPSSGGHWLALLTVAASYADAALRGTLRIAAQEALMDAARGETERMELCLACAKHNPQWLLELTGLSALLLRLSLPARDEIKAALSRFIKRAVVEGRALQVADRDAETALVDTEDVVRTLAGVAPSEGAKLGANAFRCLPSLSDKPCSEWLVDLFKRTQYLPLTESDAKAIADLLGNGRYPDAARIVRETAEEFQRRDVTPIHDRIRYTYQMMNAHPRPAKHPASAPRLPKVIIATALQLEREAVMLHLGPSSYDSDLGADVAVWPANQPLFEIYVIITGAGNISSLAATMRAGRIAPALAFFVGVCGGVKDFSVGDVVYGTKVYYDEGGKEEDGGMRARPTAEITHEALVQLAHRVADTIWQPGRGLGDPVPRASAAVIASGELVLASKEPTAVNYQLLRSSYNDTQVVDMESYGFMKAMREMNVNLAMVIRGVSDRIEGKSAAEAKGSQPLAMLNASAFLFALLRACDKHFTRKGKKKKRGKGILGFLMGDERDS